MKLQYEDYGFYRIDLNYLKYLHNVDGQVFYKNKKEYDKKPHLGLLVGIEGYTYCIPLTSAKTRHLDWRDVTDYNYLIYEIVDKKELHKSDIYKQVNGSPDKYKKLLSVLEIRKMIPVNKNVINKIIFNDIQDEDYKNLLLKEYRFLSNYKKQIITKAEKLYIKQKETGIIKNCYVSFNALEKAYGDMFAEKTDEKTNEQTV